MAAKTIESPASNGRQATTFDLLKEIDRRYELQFKAVMDVIVGNDRRYEERFIGQQVALKDALTAQKDKVADALTAQRDATNKAEVAADKRFDVFTMTITKKLDDLMSSRDTGIGKGIAIREAVAYIVAAVSTVALIWGNIKHP